MRDIMVLKSRGPALALLKELGKSSYVAVSTGFWYEWSLAIPASHGFNLAKKELTLFDEGEVKASTSTWPQVGRAVAALLSLPVKAEGEDKEKCLENFRNKHVYVSSFTVSQKEMLDSVLRVTGDKISDWKITKEPAKGWYAAGIAAMKAGDRMGFVRMMYTRVYYDDGSGDYEKARGLVNGVLGLPKEDIDEATRAAIQCSKDVPFG